MATTFTANAKLAKPAVSDRYWDVAVNGNADILDALAPVGGLAVSLAEVPSTSLNVRVAPGSYRRASRAVASFAGAATQAVTASTTTLLWLTDAGTLATGTSWPATGHVRLASVVAGASTITSITDARVAFAAVQGGSITPVASASATYAATASDGLIECDATGGAFTVDLPDATLSPGLTLRPMKSDGSGNAVTIGTTHTGQTINGAGTLALTAQWQGKTLVSDGSKWLAF